MTSNNNKRNINNSSGSNSDDSVNLSIDSNPSPIKKINNQLYTFQFKDLINEDTTISGPTDIDNNNNTGPNDIDNNNNEEEYTEPNDIDDNKIKKKITTTTTTTTTTTSTIPKKTTNNFLDFNFSFDPNKNDQQEEDDELNISLTAEDILLSQIEILKLEWDNVTYNKTPPIVLQSIFNYSNKDSERSLQLLKKKNIIRIFQIATSLNDYYILITSDYIKLIESLKGENSNSSNSNGTGDNTSKKLKPENLTNNMINSSSPIKASPIDIKLLNKSQVLDLFIKKLIPNYIEVLISKSKLFQILSITNQHQQDNIITHLVQSGLLLQKEDNSFIFSIPNTGGFFKNLQKGRKEITSFIQRLKYKEILKKDLLKKKLVYSNLKMDLLIKDLLSTGKIKIIPTTQGDLIRCVQFDEL